VTPRTTAPDADRTSTALPPPPRPLTTFAGYSTSWHFALVGLVCALSVAVIALIYSANGIAPVVLDPLDGSGRTIATVPGEVTAIRATIVNTPDGKMQRVRYAFTPAVDRTGTTGNETVNGETTVHPGDLGRLQEGDRVMVRHALDDPAWNRLADIEPARPSPVVQVLLVLLVAGSTLVLLWLRAVMRARVVLRDGLETAARVEAMRPWRWLNPPHAHIDVGFCDRLGNETKATVFVAVSDPFARDAAAALAADGPRPFVRILFDERDPRRVLPLPASSTFRGVRA
jgi:hypothetical protein